MSNDRLLPTSSKYGVITFDILVNGNAIDLAYQVLSIAVSRVANRIPTAKIIIRDGNVAKEDFEISSSEDFVPGAEIGFDLGRDSINENAFKGIITKQCIKIKENGSTVLQIECKDESFKMALGRKNKYFEKKKDSAIIEEILSEYGMNGKVDATNLVHEEMVQYNCSDWDFILARAEANGLLLMVNDGKVDVVAPDTSPEPKYTVLYGATMYEFNAEMDALTQFETVTASSWDYANQELIEAENTSSKFKSNGNLDGKKLAEVPKLKSFELRHTGISTKEELQQWSDACRTKYDMAMMRGRVKIEGFSDLKLGDMLGLQGVGDRFNGGVFITGISHQIFEGTWFAHLQFGLDPNWAANREDIMAPPAAGLLPGISGLQIGKVVDLEDPEGKERIQVKIPIIDNAANGVWARLASLDAGKNRGFVFRPEIDDEVIVGFVNDDVRHPLIIGNLHSSKNAAPIEASNDNHEKGLVTRSEMRVHFDDDKKIITIDTPAGNSLVMSEDDKSITIEDQNKNSIVMDSAGITISSPKDIVLDAKGAISMTAKMDLSMEGLNVNAKAKAQFKAEGSAGAELSTSAICTVKGSLLKLN